ncbi:MAG: IS4/IS5 family transposase, partial [Cellulosilyticaceae bacterium]
TKENLTNIIKSMTKYSWLFAKNSERNFTRKRKLDFETIMLLLLSMDGNSLSKELLEYSEYSPETATFCT